MDKTKVLLVTSAEYPVPAVRGGSIETMITDLIENNETEKKVYFTVISKYDEVAAEKAKTYQYTEVLYLNSNEKVNNKYQDWKLTQYINILGERFFRKRIIDSPYATIILKMLQGKEYDQIVVMGGNPFDYGKLSRHFGRRKLSFNVAGVSGGNRVTAKIYEHFLCCSNYTKEVIESNGVLESGRAVNMLNGIDTRKFDRELSAEEDENLRRKYSPNNEKLILFIGRIAREKGVMELLRAFSLLDKDTSCKLLVVGNSNFGYGGLTEYEKEVAEFVEKNSLNVELTGFLHHDVLWKIMKICNFAVLPSVWEEPAGNVVPECMAAGLPVIITNSGGMVEYVDSTCGIVVEKEADIEKKLANAMTRLLNNQELCKKMSRAASNKARNHDSKEYYSKFCSFMEKWSI